MLGWPVAAIAKGRELKILTVTEFGAVPDDGKDDTAAIRAAVEQCAKQPGSRLVFDPGQYEVKSEKGLADWRRMITSATPGKERWRGNPPQGWEGWPKDKNARFGTLRAHGAFLVSSSLKQGAVEYVGLLSERGRKCILVNPWPGKAVRLYRNDKQAEVLQTAERFMFDTAEGERIVLVPDGRSLEEARLRMQPYE